VIPGRPALLGWRGRPRPSRTAPLGMTKTPTLQVSATAVAFGRGRRRRLIQRSEKISQLVFCPAPRAGQRSGLRGAPPPHESCSALSELRCQPQKESVEPHPCMQVHAGWIDYGSEGKGRDDRFWSRHLHSERECYMKQKCTFHALPEQGTLNLRNW